MSNRISHFGDERDLCFNCQRSPEACDAGIPCTYTESTDGRPSVRCKSVAVQNTCGIPSYGVVEMNGMVI